MLANQESGKVPALIGLLTEETAGLERQGSVIHPGKLVIRRKVKKVYIPFEYSNR